MKTTTKERNAFIITSLQFKSTTITIKKQLKNFCIQPVLVVIINIATIEREDNLNVVTLIEMV